jgi:hypothetical protein
MPRSVSSTPSSRVAIADAFDRCHLNGEPARWPPARTGEAPPQRTAHSEVITGSDASQRGGEIGIPDCAIDDIDRVAADSLRYGLTSRLDDRRCRRDEPPDDQAECREAAARSKNPLGWRRGQPSGESNLVSIRVACGSDQRPLRLHSRVLVLVSNPVSPGIPTGAIVVRGADALTPLRRHVAT